MKRLWHISDTHGNHGLLQIPNNIDIVIHSGDFTNHYDVYKNEPEMKDFIHWYKSLPIKHKVLIAGNHDAYVFKYNKDFRKLCKDYNIIYLENESITIDGINIFGSPYTPTFGNWYFMKDRAKLHNLWSNIPINTNILVVHGPPKGILDCSYNKEGVMETCGCSALRKHVLNILKLKLCLFGHIHDVDDILNQGIRTVGDVKTVFSNGSVVKDGKFGYISNHGNILEIHTKKVNKLKEIWNKLINLFQRE
jgi:Icc-related predicted phosphoesterase